MDRKEKSEKPHLKITRSTAKENSSIQEEAISVDQEIQRPVMETSKSPEKESTVPQKEAEKPAAKKPMSTEVEKKDRGPEKEPAAPQKKAEKPAAKKPKTKKSDRKTRRPSPKDEHCKHYFLDAELTVRTAEMVMRNRKPGRIETPEMVVDSLGNAFTKSALEADIDDHRNLIMLNARQTELLLKLIGIAPYEQKKSPPQ